MRSVVRWAVAAVALVLVAGASCMRDETNPRKGAPDPSVTLVASDGDTADLEASSLSALRVYEDHRRKGADLLRYASSVSRFGSDPYAIVALRGAEPTRFAILLRNEDAVVVVDDGFHEIARAPAPHLASGLAVDAKGRLFVGGEGSEVVLSYQVVADALVARERKGFPDDTSIRSLAVRPSDGALAVADELADVVFVSKAGDLRKVDVPRGPNRLAAERDTLFVSSLVEHTISAIPPSGEAKPLFRLEGPIFGFDVARRGEAWIVVVGHIEDHPLDRRGGSFGFVDSFVSRYVCDAEFRCRLSRTLNVGELDLVTPKLVKLDGRGGVIVAGYASARALLLDEASLEVASTWAAPPGIADGVVTPEGLAFVSPLLDAIGSIGAKSKTVSRFSSPTRSASSRLGELLFFTTLLAPWQKSEGDLSRFTCESCHFEGLTDGRTHATGRGEVRATTKPLRGLFTNGPHFSRALDQDLSQMVHAEFRVAAANSGNGAWFGLDEAPPRAREILESINLEPRDLEALATPETMRRAFVDFLIDFEPSPNPYAIRRESFTPLEREGSKVFRDACQSCHSARLVAKDPSTSVPFEDWERLVLTGEGPIVWARDGYEKTGVEPYVADAGARPTSLRRVVRKKVYFTNGSAASIEAVLRELAWSKGGDFFHASRSEGLRRLDAKEQAALIAFLRLL